MDRVTDDIKAGLEKLGNRFGPVVIMPATVLKINGDDTIEVQLTSDLILDDVRLKSVVKAGGKFILEPTVGSTVQIGSIENSGEFIVLAVEEITRIYTKIGSLEFELKDKFLIKKGADSLKDAIKLIIESVQQIVVTYGNNPDYQKLAQSLQKIENLFE